MGRRRRFILVCGSEFSSSTVPGVLNATNGFKGHALQDETFFGEDAPGLGFRVTPKMQHRRQNQDAQNRVYRISVQLSIHGDGHQQQDRLPWIDPDAVPCANLNTSEFIGRAAGPNPAKSFSEPLHALSQRMPYALLDARLCW